MLEAPQHNKGAYSLQPLQLLLLFLILHSTAQASIMRTPPLIQAVQSGHMHLVGQLIGGGAEVNIIDAWGRTATHYAVSRDNQEALKFLLDRGADANLADNDGNTPLDMWHEHKNEEMLKLLHAAGAKPLDLWQAAADNDRAAAERLLTAGEDAKAENDVGKVPFDIAIEAEHYALAAILLKAAVGINGRDKKGWSPLHWAIFSDAWDLVQEFIGEGADFSIGRTQNAFDLAKSMKSEAKLIEVFIAKKGIDAPVGRGRKTLLMHASERRQTELVKLLIENNADLNITTNRGETALMRAAEKKYKEIFRLLIKHGADKKGYPPLHQAIMNDDWDLVRKFIAEGADIFAGSSQNAFELATLMKSEAKLIEVFIAEKGVDATIRGAGTSLMNAVVAGDVETAKLLIAHVADINIQINRKTALLCAATEGNTEIVQLLIDNGADPNIDEYHGITALMNAARSGHTEIVKLLIDSGADPNTKNVWRETALLLAAGNGHMETVKLLIENGADPNIQEKLGYTALMHAAEKGRTKIVKLLIDNNADLNIKNLQGESAINIAKKYNFQEITDILSVAQQGST